jgi:hypothetical protein
MGPLCWRLFAHRNPLFAARGSSPKNGRAGYDEGYRPQHRQEVIKKSLTKKSEDALRA